MMLQAIFEISNLTKEYNGAKVVDIKQMSFKKGTVSCVYGSNGSGKTTLFELLTLIHRPTTGTIAYKGMEVFPAGEGIKELRSQVTMVHQNPLLFNTSVEKNVDYGLRIRGISSHERHARVGKSLAVVGLHGIQKRKARELSGGEAQRVAIARALCIDPEVLLLDEFSANIDQENRLILEEIIRDINSQFGTTILFTTHYIEQAHRLSDHVINLYKGMAVEPHIRNVMRGTIRSDSGMGLFENEKVRLYLTSAIRGAATIAIPLNAVTISREPLCSSMRNCIKGHITHIIDEDQQVMLRVLAGDFFESVISKVSLRELGLGPGTEVYVNFKASSVEVL